MPGMSNGLVPSNATWWGTLPVILDPCANYCLPMLKLIGLAGIPSQKDLRPAQIHFKRLVETGVLGPQHQHQRLEYAPPLNSLAINRHFDSCR